MTVRFRYLLAAVGLWMVPPLPGLVAGETVPPHEPARLTIEPGPGTAGDQQTANAIAERLQHSGQLRHYRIEVACRAGAVELTGHVADEAQREAALRLVRDVPGVERVVDRLTLSGAVTPVQAEAVPPPAPATREPAQVLPRAPTPAGPVVEPMPMAAGTPGSPYDLMSPPHMPPYAWPTYAPYNNYSRVAYPLAYPYNAWPFIGPPYPFPKIPLGWRKVKLEWQDGHWWFSKLATKSDWWRLRYW